MITKAMARMQLLGMANEDVYGLYEAAGTMNTLFPKEEESQNRVLAEQLLRELLAEGLIYLCYEKKWAGGPRGPRSLSRSRPKRWKRC